MPFDAPPQRCASSTMDGRSDAVALSEQLFQEQHGEWTTIFAFTFHEEPYGYAIKVAERYATEQQAKARSDKQHRVNAQRAFLRDVVLDKELPN